MREDEVYFTELPLVAPITLALIDYLIHKVMKLLLSFISH